jgi:hypothetical protein
MENRSRSDFPRSGRHPSLTRTGLPLSLPVPVKRALPALLGVPPNRLKLHFCSLVENGSDGSSRHIVKCLIQWRTVSGVQWRTIFTARRRMARLKAKAKPPTLMQLLAAAPVSMPGATSPPPTPERQLTRRQRKLARILEASRHKKAQETQLPRML